MNILFCKFYNKYFLVSILLITLTIIQTIYSFNVINDDQIESKLDEIRQVPSSAYISSLPLLRQTNAPECLSKTELSNMVNRERRASISRPFFSHWRPVRDRYSTKNLLAFSPRLGRRSYEDENELDNVENKLTHRSTDLGNFLVTLVSYLRGKNIDIVYEDSNKICLSQSISDVLIQEILDKLDVNRRNQDEQDKEEIRERQAIAKHPILFRYRLG